jgi:hypothetical protein
MQTAAADDDIHSEAAVGLAFPNPDVRYIITK